MCLFHYTILRAISLGPKDKSRYRHTLFSLSLFHTRLSRAIVLSRTRSSRAIALFHTRSPCAITHLPLRHPSRTYAPSCVTSICRLCLTLILSFSHFPFPTLSVIFLTPSHYFLSADTFSFAGTLRVLNTSRFPFPARDVIPAPHHSPPRAGSPRASPERM